MIGGLTNVLRHHDLRVDTSYIRVLALLRSWIGFNMPWRGHKENLRLCHQGNALDVEALILGSGIILGEIPCKHST